jgi:FtsZ-binding cell division protein ZapB
MATIDPNRALPVYQARVSNMINDIILRDIAISELEESNSRLQQENVDLRKQVHDLTPGRDPAAPSEVD